MKTKYTWLKFKLWHEHLSKTANNSFIDGKNNTCLDLDLKQEAINKDIKQENKLAIEHVNIFPST